MKRFNNVVLIKSLLIRGLKQIAKYLPERLRNFLLRNVIRRKYKTHLGKGVIVSRCTILEPNTYINANCNISGSYIGSGTFIAQNSAVSKTKIGRFCSIGQDVRTCIGRHPSHVFVSSHPSFFSTQKQAGFTFVGETIFQEHRYIDAENGYVVDIGNDVWIGNDVIIMDGIAIGDGAIIGTGSIVTKNIEPYSINVGVPAMKIADRFERQYIKFLINFKWWEKEWDWIKNNSELFQNIEKFYEKYHLEIESKNQSRPQEDT